MGAAAVVETNEQFNERVTEWRAASVRICVWAFLAGIVWVFLVGVYTTLTFVRQENILDYVRPLSEIFSLMNIAQALAFGVGLIVVLGFFASRAAKGLPRVCRDMTIFNSGVSFALGGGLLFWINAIWSLHPVYEAISVWTKAL